MVQCTNAGCFCVTLLSIHVLSIRKLAIFSIFYQFLMGSCSFAKKDTQTLPLSSIVTVNALPDCGCSHCDELSVICQNTNTCDSADGDDKLIQTFHVGIFIHLFIYSPGQYCLSFSRNKFGSVIIVAVSNRIPTFSISPFMFSTHLYTNVSNIIVQSA